MTKNKISMLFIAFAMVLFASCGGTAIEASEEEVDVSAILTAGIGTFAASIFETQTAFASEATETPSLMPQSTSSPIAINSPLPTTTQGFVFVPVVGTVSVSPSPTGTRFTPTPNPSTLAFGCNNLLLLRDETVPAGTVFRPGESFTKTWKVQNNGTCNWVFQYRLVFVGGNQMDGDPAGLGKVIEPQKWTQISISLTAPRQPGTYTATWRLGTQAGNPFGSTLTVSIVVAPPTNTPLPPSATPVPPSATNTPTPSDTPTPTETYTPTP